MIDPMVEDVNLETAVDGLVVVMGLSVAERAVSQDLVADWVVDWRLHFEHKLGGLLLHPL